MLLHKIITVCSCLQEHEVLDCRGELPEDMSSAYEKQRKGYETLQRTVSTLADALEKPMPDLPEPSSVTHTKDGGINVISGRVNLLLSM